MTPIGSPRYVTAFNRGARVVSPFVRLDPQNLSDAARRRTRLEDFGDSTFRAPLARLVEGLNHEAGLTLLGRIAARKDMGRLLASRLRMVEDRRSHPEIAAEEINRPIVITGLPRTGTTILHAILSQDPRNRVPLTWETMYPSPPPRTLTYNSDRRIQITRRQLGWLHRLAPDFRRIHPVDAQLPQECLVLQSLTFESYQFETMYDVPSYHSWLEAEDLRHSYEGHRFFLQNLQWRCRSERWVLKAPAHLFGLPALFATYPDAGVVMTHRAPLEVVGSLASLTAVLRGAFSETVNPKRVGPEMTVRWQRGMTKALADRDAGCAPSNQFFDVDYRELVRDPIGIVHGMYRHFGIDWCSEAEARMRAFLARNPKDKHGKHIYTLEQFGLDADEERERYRAYSDRFGL